MQRENLIQGLAQSFGVIDSTIANMSGSHYDKATGTLYCNGVPMSKHKIQEAKKHFETQINYYKALAGNGDKNAINNIMYLNIAINSINLLEESIKIQEEYKNKK